MMNKVSIYKPLNGLRGFAVLLVLLSHASNKGIGYNEYINFSGAGRYGVFLFFVLSAFLLTKQLLNMKTENIQVDRNLKHYFFRRFIRIYPLFIVSLFTYYLLTKFNLPVIEISEIDFLKSLLLLEGKGVFWTVAVEFQYYFVLPVIVWILLKINNIITILISCFLFVLLWSYLFPPTYVVQITPFLPIFMIGSIGAFISNYLEQNNYKKYILLNTFNLIALMSFLAFFIFIPSFFNLIFEQSISRTHFHYQFIFFAIISILLTLSITHGNGIIKKLMETRFLIFWGKVSFSAYLGHMILLNASTLVSDNNYINLIVFLISTAFLSFLSYKYFELPLSKIHSIKVFRSKHLT